MEIIRDPHPTEWDQFVTESPSGIFSHGFGWGKALADTYALPFYPLAARRNRRIAGIAPLIHFEAPEKAPRLIALPYSDAAGILAGDEEAAADLLSAALRLAEDLDAVHLELRQPAQESATPLPISAAFNGWHHFPHTFKVGLSRALPDSSETLFATLSAKVRNQVRKAWKCGCRAETGGDELLEDFFAVFSENMRDLGSPVHAPELFSQVVEALPARVFVVTIENTPAAASIAFRHGDILFNPWASSLRRFRPSCPNMLLYWTMLEHGAESGCRRFDFGRSSPGASTCRFKLQWGADMRPLVWHVFSREPARWDPRKESLVKESWKTLNLTASRRQGPAVRRWISL